MKFFQLSLMNKVASWGHYIDDRRDLFHYFPKAPVTIYFSIGLNRNKCYYKLKREKTTKSKTKIRYKLKIYICSVMI